MTPVDKELELQAFRTVEDDTKTKLEFKVKNVSEKKLYEFLKLYLKTNYVGLKYLDIGPGETKKISFTVDNTAVTYNPVVYLTTRDKEEGVLLEERYEVFKEQESSQVKETVKTWDELEEEYQDLMEEEKTREMPERLEEEYREFIEREATDKESFLKSVVNSLKKGEKEEETDKELGKEPEKVEEEEETKELEEDETEEDEKEEILPSEKVDRITTGIINLDKHMQGGLVQGTMNLVTGKTGTGKTAFCASFLKGGAENNSPGVYVTTEEREEDIKADIKAMFGWEFDHLEEEGLVKILSIKPIFPSKEIQNLNRLVRSYISNLLDQVMHAVEEIEAERVIIDSVSIVEMFIRDEYMSRVALASLLNKLREANVTAVLTGTVPETSQGLSGGGIIEFLVDTVILLEFVPVAEDHQRTLTIRKMRRTDHNVNILPMGITKDGVKVFEV